MAIYVDLLFTAIPRTAEARQHGNRRCHLITDGGLEELHQFAELIGLKRSYFQRAIIPHYDLTPAKRVIAAQKGAIEATNDELCLLRKSWRCRWNRGEPDW